MKKNCTSTSDFHPWYNKYLPVWKKQRDSVSSELTIKNKAYAQGCQMINNCSDFAKYKAPNIFSYYLPPTEGMIRTNPCNVGITRYWSYVFKAKWHPYPLDTHDQALGMINNQRATVELPSSLEYLKQDATTDNESLETVLDITYSNQIVNSRVGLLAEVTSDTNKPFNIATYTAETITDWVIDIDENGDEKVQWVKLLTDECDDRENSIYLILMINPETGNYIQYQTINKSEEYGTISGDMIPDSMVEPMIREQSAQTIPFVVVNLTQLGVNTIEKPWLESLSDSAFKLFQGDADYKWGLYWGGQSTFWSTGISKDEASKISVGNGGRAFSASPEAKFGYINAGTDGIEPSRKNVEDMKADCVALGVDLINQGVESGVALDTRMSVKTASLKTLAQTGAEGLLRLLKMCNVWLGGSEEDVVVVPNTEFADKVYTADDLQKFGSLVSVGVMLEEDYYNILKKQGITSKESFDDWRESREGEVMTGALIQ